MIGHAPGNAGTTHEATTRAQNLFGKTYPAATLKDLGLKPRRKRRKEQKKKQEARQKNSKNKGKQA